MCDLSLNNLRDYKAQKNLPDSAWNVIFFMSDNFLSRLLSSGAKSISFFVYVVRFALVRCLMIAQMHSRVLMENEKRKIHREMKNAITLDLQALHQLSGVC